MSADTHPAPANPLLHWYEDRSELARLWAWLDEHGEAPADGPAYFIEKAHKWTPEHDRMLAREQEERHAA